MKHPDRHEDRQPRTPGCRRGEPAPPDERWCLRSPACPRHISLITNGGGQEEAARTGTLRPLPGAGLTLAGAVSVRLASPSAAAARLGNSRGQRSSPGSCLLMLVCGRAPARSRSAPADRPAVERGALPALPPQLNPPTLSLSPLSSRRALISHRRAPWAPRSSSVLAPSLSSRRFPGRHANLPTPRPWLYQSFDGQI